MRTATIQTRANDDRDRVTSDRITRWRDLAAESRRLRPTDLSADDEAAWAAYGQAVAAERRAYQAI